MAGSEKKKEERGGHVTGSFAGGSREGLQGRGTNYFSLFVSYRFTSNKTQLTEFPESKSDMPLFLWVLALK